MADPEPITPLNEGTSSQNAQSIIEGHVSALKELLKEPDNRNLIKPILLDFDDIQDVSDEEIEGGVKGKAKVGDEDLSKPFKEVLKCPFTRRIIEFWSPGHRFLKNARIYDETGDPKDHVGRFVGIGNQGEWPMPVWCRMFQQTLDGKARAWFDKLSSGSIDNWSDLQEKFLNRFGILKACDKDSTKISKIVQKANETLPHFKERWVSKSNYIRNVPELMQISSFMSSYNCPGLAKHFSDNIPKTVDEILKRVDDYLQSEEAFRSTELPRGNSNEGMHRCNRQNEKIKTSGSPMGITAVGKSTSLPPECQNGTPHAYRHSVPVETQLVGVPSKENLNRYCGYHNEKGHNTNDCNHLKRQLEIALKSGKLNHLIKDVRQRGKGGKRSNGLQKAKVINMVQCYSLDRKRKTIMMDEEWMNVPIIFPQVLARDLSEEALVVEAEVEGYLVQRIHIDEGASVEIMFEHCFNMLHLSIWSKLVKTQTTVFGFLGEQVKPLGKIKLNVQMAEEDEEKMAFYTDRGTYCYTKMSFGLKNAGATYQRLVDGSFNTQIKRSLEAYVDDMKVQKGNDSGHSRNIQQPQTDQHEVKSEEMLIWSRGRKVIRLHGYLKGNTG
nr:reverse transcriptase domain-containing protein [Tanacetum cinerariifolium]